jgi:hypothetical protein
MPSTINAQTSPFAAVIMASDGTGNLAFQTSNTTAMTLDTSGNMAFNSGYGSAATAYGCRAWVNFNGITNSIRASGNISSITDDGTALYTINFTNAMPDANYTMVSSTQAVSTQTSGRGFGFYATDNDGTSSVVTTTSCKVLQRAASNIETFYMCLAFFR